ncbi:MAG: NUDIX hydrolase [Candidatus Harrisonbacteria bacterium]|nr:NUDIX hydrolase [Candidatus Harrisonbacteria bacterium]
MISGICASVTAVLRNPKDEVLVVYRFRNPKGLATPAGHIKWEEDAGVAIRRIIPEITDITVKDIVRKKEQLIDVSPVYCNRGKGIHVCYVYEILSWNGNPKVMKPIKHKFVRFMPKSEVAEYIKHGEIDPCFPKILWEKLGIL